MPITILTGIFGVWNGNNEVNRLAARLAVEMATGLFVKGYVQNLLTRMDSAGQAICTDRMSLPSSAQPDTLQGATWAWIADQQKLGAQTIEQIQGGTGPGWPHLGWLFGGEPLDNQCGTFEAGEEGAIRGLPMGTTTFRNCGDMAISGHTNVVLFSRLYAVTK